MKESVEANLPPLAKCAQADMYAQIDDAIYFPQIELLEEIVQGHPNATFFLTFRSMEKWYHSITHWPPRPKGPHMSDRMKKFNITGSPNLDDNDPEDFYDWYCNHVQRVRDIVARNPSHTLVEVDIEDPTVGQRMEDMFGIEKSCWGHKNVNAYIHPELNESEVEVSKHFRKNQKQNKDNDEEEDYSGDPTSMPSYFPTQQDGNSSADESFVFATIQSRKNVSHPTSDDDVDESHRFMEDFDDAEATNHSNDMDEDEEDQSVFNQTCFRARADTVPLSLYHKLPKPYINLGE